MRKHQEDRIEDLDIDSLRTNPLQSGDRTAAKAIKSLQSDMAERGLQSFPAVYRLPNGDLIIGDGHRRITVAKALGWRSIKCIVIAARDIREAKQAFIRHAGVTRNIKGKEQFFAWGQADKKTREDMQDRSASLRNNLTKLVRIFGPDRTEEIALTNCYADAVIKLIAQLLGKMEMQTDMRMPSSGLKVTRRAVGEWCLTHKTQNWLTRMFREDKFNDGNSGAEECQRVLALIELNKPPSARISKKLRRVA